MQSIRASDGTDTHSRPWHQAKLLEYAIWTALAGGVLSAALTELVRYGTRILGIGLFWQSHWFSLTVVLLVGICLVLSHRRWGGPPIASLSSMERRSVHDRTDENAPVLNTIESNGSGGFAFVDDLLGFNQIAFLDRLEPSIRVPFELLIIRSQRMAKLAFIRAHILMASGLCMGLLAVIAFVIYIFASDLGRAMAQMFTEGAHFVQSLLGMIGAGHPISQPVGNSTASDGNVSWPQLGLALAHSVPRVVGLLAVEVLSGFLLKQYRIAMAEFREYEQVLRDREALITAYFIWSARSRT
jgi:hypothetical protein